MSSSPTGQAGARFGRVSGVAAVLAAVPDPRRRRGVRHGVAGVVAVALAAVLTGARSYAAIGEWAAELTGAQLSEFGLSRPVAPSSSTFRRLLARLDAGVLDALVGAFLWTRSSVVGGRRVIAVDGKTIRGARTLTDTSTSTWTAPHLVSAFDHATGTVLGQLATAAKSNEIPAVRTLLGLFDLTGVVVTIDAMHTQDDTAQAILDGGGDYVLTVKGNRPTLLAAVKALPWKHVPTHSGTDRSRGRRITRTIKVLQAPSDLPDWVDFPGAAQVAQIRRTRTITTKNRGRKKTVEVVYVITSADHRTAPSHVLAAWVQGHWGIENRTHWVRDVVFDEDRCQIRAGNGPHVMATLRNTAISLLRLAGWTNIAAALRHHARQPDRPLNLLLTP